MTSQNGLPPKNPKGRRASSQKLLFKLSFSERRPLAFSMMPLSIMVMSGATSTPALAAAAASMPTRIPSLCVFHCVLDRAFSVGVDGGLVDDVGGGGGNDVVDGVDVVGAEGNDMDGIEGSFGEGTVGSLGVGNAGVGQSPSFTSRIAVSFIVVVVVVVVIVEASTTRCVCVCVCVCSSSSPHARISSSSPDPIS